MTRTTSRTEWTISAMTGRHVLTLPMGDWYLSEHAGEGVKIEYQPFLDSEEGRVLGYWPTVAAAKRAVARELAGRGMPVPCRE